MAGAESNLIAAEIVTAVNAESFSMPFVAERAYLPDWSIKDELGDLQCIVWPSDPSAEMWERSGMLETYKVGVSFAKTVEAVEISVIDGLAGLVKEVVRFLELKDIELTSDNRQFWFMGWDFLEFVSDRGLDRNKGRDGIPKYTGVFHSHFVLDYQASE